MELPIEICEINGVAIAATVRIGALLLKRLPGYHILSCDPVVYERRQPDTVRGPDVLAISAERQERTRPIALPISA